VEWHLLTGRVGDVLTRVWRLCARQVRNEWIIEDHDWEERDVAMYLVAVCFQSIMTFFFFVRKGDGLARCLQLRPRRTGSSFSTFVPAQSLLTIIVWHSTRLLVVLK
jgi:hypothetical protein